MLTGQIERKTQRPGAQPVTGPARTDLRGRPMGVGGDLTYAVRGVPRCPDLPETAGTSVPFPGQGAVGLT
ncbi:hypothetical protein WBG99_07085 [Streptomyces sp. TG1A-60]|uniref:hypothetical protein n=1 Tax=Streptomyces sp. TG1A-60 TaxID=3129111 RepID=UPI0030D1C372